MLDAAAMNHATQDDLPIEESLFSHHESKYKITMDYLENWITVNEGLWTSLAQRLGWNLNQRNSNALRAERREIREHGAEIRESCMYVDYPGRWVNRTVIPRQKVVDHINMAKSMMSGLEGSVSNWQFGIS